MTNSSDVVAERNEPSIDAPSAALGYRLGGWDFLVAALIAGGAFTMLWLDSTAFPHPGAWANLASAAGIQAPATVHGGFWRYCLSLLFNTLGTAKAFTALDLLGGLAGAWCAATTYVVFRTYLPMLLGVRVVDVLRFRLLVQGVLFMATALVIMSDPWRRMFMYLTPETIWLTVGMTALVCQVRFLQNQRLRLLAVAYLCAGALVADSIIGPFTLLAMYLSRLIARHHATAVPTEDDGHRGPLNQNSLLLNPLVSERVKWPLVFCFLIGFFGVAVMNVRLFGLGASVIVKWGMEFVAEFKGLASQVDWVLAFALILFPFAANLFYIRRATDVERFLPRHLGLFFGVTGLVAYSQLCGFSRLWFWTWTSSGMPPVAYLHCLWLFLAAAVVAMSISVFSVDFFCRNHFAIIQRLYPDAEEWEAEAEAHFGKYQVVKLMRQRRVKGALFTLVPVLLVGIVLPSRPDIRERPMLALVAEVLKETVRECGSAERLVSDEVLETGLRLAALLEGRPLEVCSVDELQASEREVVSTNCAWQTGFFSSGLIPDDVEFSGLVARQGLTPADCAEGVARTEALAQKILDLYHTDIVARCADKHVRRTLELVQWRMARFARRRIEELDRAGRGAEALAATRLCDELDALNAPLAEGLARMSTPASEGVLLLTAREGLRIALERRNFSLAMRFAPSLLKKDAQDVEANFACGMMFYEEEQYGRAVEHLTRAVKGRPKDLVLLNNLAAALYRAGKFAESAAMLKRAQEVAPGSAAVKDNLQILEQAQKKPRR